MSTHRDGSSIRVFVVQVLFSNAIPGESPYASCDTVSAQRFAMTQTSISTLESQKGLLELRYVQI